MSDDERIYVLMGHGQAVGYVRSAEIAQWWALQKIDRCWWTLEPKQFSNEEATKIVYAIIVKKDEP